jgi:hypothetical protein
MFIPSLPPESPQNLPSALLNKKETGFSGMMAIPDVRGKHKNVPGFIFVNRFKFVHIAAD